MTLREALEDLLPRIEAELAEITRTSRVGLDRFYGMMHYHLGWTNQDFEPVAQNTGKRLRPTLCLLACQALGGDPEQALPAACALELIHNFSLIHDDIQDISRTRRGRRAVWDIWGTAHGINVGDGLFVLARMALHRLGERGVALHRQHAATTALDQASLALCEGQYCDMIFEERLDVDVDQYMQMVRHKTAALFAASTMIGAIVAADDQVMQGHFYQFGENLGIAFQIQDDILGAWGDEQLTGKSSATDIRAKKKTLPIVFALNQGQHREAAQQLANLYARHGPLDEEAIQASLSVLERVGARRYAEERAGHYYARALAALGETGIRNESLAHLRDLASSLLGRRT